MHKPCIAEIIHEYDIQWLHTTKQNQQQQINTHLSLCSGVKLGDTLSRSSINIKSLPSPSYFANSILSPLFADRMLDDMRGEVDVAVCVVVERVAKAFAIGMTVRIVAIESIVIVFVAVENGGKVRVCDRI